MLITQLTLFNMLVCRNLRRGLRLCRLFSRHCLSSLSATSYSMTADQGDQRCIVRKSNLFIDLRRKCMFRADRLPWPNDTPL